MPAQGAVDPQTVHPNDGGPLDLFSGIKSPSLRSGTSASGEGASPDSHGPRTLRSLLRERRLPALDGLRAVAVGMVIGTHQIGALGGDLGVIGFFVLSGFLITWLLLRELAATGSVSLPSFYWRRTLRIVPAYAAYCLVVATLYVLKHGHLWDPKLTLAALTYTTNYYNVAHLHMATPLSHTWSLAVEEQFYLLWPLGFLALRRGSPRWRMVVLGLAVAAVCAWRSFAYVGLHAGEAYVYNAFETRFDSLAIGCLLALAAVSGRLDRPARMLTASWMMPLGTLLLLGLSRCGGDNYHYGPGFTVESVLLAVLIVQMLLLVRSRAWSWLEHPIARNLGVLSYPLYLYHGLGLTFGRKLVMLPPGLQIVVGLLATLATAALSYYCVERPFLGLRQRFRSLRQRRRTVYVFELGERFN